MSITETVWPTAERLRKSHYEGPAVDQQTSRKNFRILSLMETIYRQHKISENAWKAYRRFEGDWTASQYHASRVCRYGASSGSTPLNQLTDIAMDAAEMGIERRSFAEQRVRSALAAVGGQPQVALLMVIDSASGDLAAIGRAISGYRAKMQAQAAAMTLIHVALDRLCLHYDEG